MATFEESIHSHFDTRIATLGTIKARSIGADLLTLTALNVFVYAQLEGGVKDLTSCVIRHLNSRKLTYGQIKPTLLNWRNYAELDRFKSVVDFDMVGRATPFFAILAKRAKVRPINRRYELNQMGWPAIHGVYTGLGLDKTNIVTSKSQIDQMVDDRNNAAHHGALPSIAATLAENQLRGNIAVVETVLTDFSLQLLPFFLNNLHRR